MARHPRRVSGSVGGGIWDYDVGPDGKRIAALMPAQEKEQSAQNRVIFLENFIDELRRRVPKN